VWLAVGRKGELTGCRAGALGIAKGVKTPSLGTEDDCKFSLFSRLILPLDIHLTRLAADNLVDLFIWDVAEALVTLMAACVPALRLFFREKTSSRTSNERTTRFSQFSLSFRTVNRGRRMFDRQTIEVIREHSVEKGEVVTGSGISRDGSAAGTESGSGTGSWSKKPAVSEKSAQ